MKNMSLCLMVLLMFQASSSTIAAEAKSGSEAKPPASKAEAKKAPAKPKSGWDKFTASVKHGAKKPVCNQAQHTLKQC